VPPIIALQADHGPGSRLYWEDPIKTDHRGTIRYFECAILSGDARFASVRVDFSSEHLPRDPQRVLRTRFELLPDRSFYTTRSRPYRYLDVTATLVGDGKKNRFALTDMDIILVRVSTRFHNFGAAASGFTLLSPRAIFRSTTCDAHPRCFLGRGPRRPRVRQLRENQSPGRLCLPPPGDPRDLSKARFKCGLEIHQQLKTAKKLFCHCPAGVYQHNGAFDAEVIRHMRPTLSEMGEYDGTALMEKKTRKMIVYRIADETACTYDFDDTPPFKIDRQALDIALEIALLLKTNIVGELHITRSSILTAAFRPAFSGPRSWA